MIIGTAGHIDHGKTALVEALTGRRLDPLAEERRRGVTLDLHFAELPLGDGRSAGIIDVPGHEDLVRTMIAGAGALDLVLLVVAADDGIMPQTREHLAIVEHLRVPAGIPVLTRADLVEPEWLALVSAEVSAWLADSPVRFTSPVVTAAPSGRGLAELRAAIGEQTAALPARRHEDDLFRLPIDRAFSLPGAGTVVTGTAWSGVLRPGDAVRVLPSGEAGRVRSLERHGAEVSACRPGDRTAVAIAGVARGRVRRGDLLVRADHAWDTSAALDVELELLPAATSPLTGRTRVRVHLGTVEVMARVQTPEPIRPGSRGMARLALESPMVARGGDRLVLRSYSPIRTIGGGQVLDPSPPRTRATWPASLASRDPAERLEALLARRRDGVPVAGVAQLVGVAPRTMEGLLETPRFVRANGRLYRRVEVERVEADVLSALAAFHARNPSESGMSLETLRAGRGPLGREVVESLAAAGRLVVEEGRARAPGFRPAHGAEGEWLERVVAAVESAGLAPPSVPELEAQLGHRALEGVCRAAEQQGRLVRVERDRFYAPVALAGLRETLGELTRAGPLAPTAIRDALGISRKYLIPLLEWADRTGLTIRRGDLRVAGPALQPGRPAR